MYLVSNQYFNPGSDNKEFCVIPLNTAPPFEGTDVGLRTPSSNADLLVVGLTFNSLKMHTPSGNVQAITPPTNATHYFPIVHNGTTYKALLA